MNIPECPPRPSCSSLRFVVLLSHLSSSLPSATASGSCSGTSGGPSLDQPYLAVNTTTHRARYLSHSHSHSHHSPVAGSVTPTHLHETHLANQLHASHRDATESSPSKTYSTRPQRPFHHTSIVSKPTRTVCLLGYRELGSTIHHHHTTLATFDCFLCLPSQLTLTNPPAAACYAKAHRRPSLSYTHVTARSLPIGIWNHFGPLLSVNFHTTSTSGWNKPPSHGRR